MLQVFRQRNPEFVRMLNDIRTGNGTVAIQQLLKQCTRPLPEQHGVKPTQLFSRNADVDTVNAAELKALQGEEVSHRSSSVSFLPPLSISADQDFGAEVRVTTTSNLACTSGLKCCDEPATTLYMAASGLTNSVCSNLWMS